MSVSLGCETMLVQACFCDIESQLTSYFSTSTSSSAKASMVVLAFFATGSPERIFMLIKYNQNGILG